MTAVSTPPSDTDLDTHTKRASDSDKTEAQTPRLRVLTTRPEPENTQLSHVLEIHGWETISLPLVSFSAIDSPTAFDVNGKAALSEEALIKNCAQTTLVIIVSPRAVTYGIPWLKQHAPHVFWQCHWLTIGPATSRALKTHHVQTHTPPSQGLTSETLLQNPLLQADSPVQNILILRGEGGRSTLQDTLHLRGHRVLTLDVYRRHVPTYTVPDFREKLAQTYDCYICTSGEILQNLTALLHQWGPKAQNPQVQYPHVQYSQTEHTQTLSNRVPQWLETPIMIVGHRQCALAQQAGFRHCVVSPTADTQTLVDTLDHWRAHTWTDAHYE